MPAVSERQRRFMGAELSRHRRGKKTRTGMSESKLEDFASKSVGDVMEKNVVVTINKYLSKTDVEKGIGDIARKLTGQKPKAAPSPTPEKPPRFAGYASAGYPKMGSVDKQENGNGQGKRPNPSGIPIRSGTYTPSGVVEDDETGMEPDRKNGSAPPSKPPPIKFNKQENGYPPTKGERRDAKRAKAKKMKVTGAGAKNLQRIIGVKADAVGKMEKSFTKGNKVEKSIIKAITKFLGKQSSEATAADPEAAKRAASRARQEAGVGKPMPAPYVHTTPDPLTGKKPPKKPKPSWAAVERPEGVQRTSVGQGGGMVAKNAKSDKQLVKAISTYLKEDTPKYNKKAVDTAIKRDKSIGKKEAKAIHGLLRGRQKSDS